MTSGRCCRLASNLNQALAERLSQASTTTSQPSTNEATFLGSPLPRTPPIPSTDQIQRWCEPPPPTWAIQLVQTAANAIEVGQFDDVKVRQLQATASPLHGEGDGRGLAHAQARDAHRLVFQGSRLFAGDFVSVAVGSDFDECIFRQDMHQLP